MIIDDRQREIMIIAQEEAAEVIQEISKIFRFGVDNLHRDGMTHRQRLEEEVGDLMCMVDLMCKHGLLDRDSVRYHSHLKAIKLKKWSSIYK